jgi:MscS family membrane protein
MFVNVTSKTRMKTTRCRGRRGPEALATDASTWPNVLLSAALVVTLGTLGATLLAQAPVVQPAPTATPPAVEDPLGRGTPAGTVRGFNAAARRNEFALAARYLQVARWTDRELEGVSRDLSDLLDRYFMQRLTALSVLPEGTLDDGLAPDRERLVLTIGESRVDIYLTRVTEPGGGTVWLFASETLAEVPELRRSAADTWVEQTMPAPLVSRSYLGASLAKWVLWAASIVVPLSLFWGLMLVVGLIVKWRIGDPTRRTVFESWWKGMRWLLALCLALLAHLSLMPSLGFSLTFRFPYTRGVLTLGVVLLALLIWRLVSVSFLQARAIALRRGRSDTESLVRLGERVVKVCVLLIALLGLLALAGLDLTTALAGVGIVGVAIALGAQKTIENLLGGIFLLTDKALAVGDFCKLSDREGWIEDITLRSIRLRTVQQTLLSVPAGLLAQGSLENFSTRRKILIQNVLRLRYGTTSPQLETILQGIRQLLASHPQIERDTARVRLADFGAQAIELELFGFVLTADYATFLAVREGLLLQIAGIIEKSGSAFAMPTEFLYLPNQTAADEADTSAGMEPSRPASRSSSHSHL